MPTWRTSARNQFRTTAGVTGEAPDGPGAFAQLSDDVDNYLGIGGAEYAANAAALAAIPAGRRFLGKLVYQADIATTWRYVGNGGTNLGSNDSTHPWQAWHRPLAYVSSLTAQGYTLGSGTVVCSTQIVAGRLFLDFYLTAGTGFSWTSGVDLQFTMGPGNALVGQFGIGSGFLYPANATGSGSQIPVVPFVVGAAAGTLASIVRVRIPRANSATSPQNTVLVSVFAAVGAGSTTDQMGWSISSPSGLVA